MLSNGSGKGCYFHKIIMNLVVAFFRLAKVNFKRPILRLVVIVTYEGEKGPTQRTFRLYERGVAKSHGTPPPI